MITCTILFFCPPKTVDAKPVDQAPDTFTQAWMQSVLDTWQVVCRHHLHIDDRPLPWIIFYDESVAYHVNPERPWLPAFQETDTSLIYAEQTYPLIRVVHRNDSLWVPGREALEARPQAVTMLYDGEQKPYFIIALPALYHRLASADQARQLDELFLGLAAHELTHTRQVVHAARRIENLRTSYALPESIDDNIIQREFGADSAYVALYERERRMLMDAVRTADIDSCRGLAVQFLSFVQQRKERFFIGAKAGYSDLEDIFLTLEGLAMWVQFQVARDRAPAGEEWLQTLISVARHTDSWSQEEGLGLFLLIDRLVQDGQARFWGPDFPSPFTVLGETIQRPADPDE